MQAFTIPNLLTLGRMILTVCFFAAGLQNQWRWALTLFVAAGLTDMVDGTIARLLKQKSRFGAAIDPAADKIMMLAGTSLLTIQGVIPWWLMAAIVGRDVYIVMGLFYLRNRAVDARPHPTILSKLTTLTQIYTISVGFAVATISAGVALPEWILWLTRSFPVAIWATMAMTFISAIDYTLIGLRLRKEAHAETI